MALRTLNRISCKLLAHPSCACEPLSLASLRAGYCTFTSPRPQPTTRQLPSVHIQTVQFSSLKTDSSPSREKEPEPGYRARLTALWDRYGVLAVTTYLGVYATTLTSVFFLLDMDLVRASAVGVDPAEATAKVCDLVEGLTGITSLPGYFREHPRAGTLAIAWMLTKFTEPLRLGVTVAIVPTIARWIGRGKDHPKAAEDRDV